MMAKDVLCQKTQALQMMSAKRMKQKVKQKGVLGCKIAVAVSFCVMADTVKQG